MSRLRGIDDLKNYIGNNTSVMLYGAGVYGKRVCVFLRQCGVDVDSFIVTDKGDCESWKGIPIVQIDDVELDDRPVIICTSDRYQDEISKELIRHNCTKFAKLSPDLCKDLRGVIDYELEIHDNINPIQVLLFHRVVDKPRDPWQLEVSPQRFEQYIEYLSKNYQIIRFEDDWSRVSEPTIVITFDDGYYDNFKYALPILEEYKVPATIFVASGSLGKGKEFWWDRLSRIIPEQQVPKVRDELKGLYENERELRLEELEKKSKVISKPFEFDRALNNDELKRLAVSDMITIGGHTITHTMLSALPIKEQEREIIESKEILEGIIGRDITTFSYPFGGYGTYTQDTVQIVKDAGFIKAASNFGGLPKENASRYEIPRFAQPECDVEEFALKIKENWMLF